MLSGISFDEVFVCLLIAGSAAVWWKAGSRFAAGLPLLPDCERPQPAGNPWAMLLAAGCVIFQLTSHIRAATQNIAREVSLETIQTSCLLNLMVVAVFLFVLTNAGRFRLAEIGFDLHDWKRQTADGIVGFFASVLPVAVLLYVTLPFRSRETQHAFLELLQSDAGPATILWVSAAAVIFAPLTEEMVFRVSLQGPLQRRMRPSAAIVLVAVLFSAVHGWPDALPLVPLALVLGYVYYRRRSYLAIVVLHGLFNAVNLLLALLSQSTEAAESAIGVR